MKTRRNDMIINISSESVGDIKIDVYKETYFNPEFSDLSEHLSAIAGQIAYWSTKLNELEKEESKIKVNYDIWFARKCETATSIMSGRPSVSAIEKTVITNNSKEYRIRQLELSDARYNVEMIKTMIESLKEKGIMLSIIAKLKKTEYDNIQ
jgi:hypothetical protein